MKPGKCYISELFNQPKRYTVPLFQRAYSWKEEEDWLPLWDDIEKKVNEADQGKLDHPHFMGTVVLRQLQTFGSQLLAREIIDGQQRLTTFQILFSACRNLASEIQHEDLRKQIDEEMMFNTGRMHEPEIEKFKVWGSEVDIEVFKDVLLITSSNELETKYPATIIGNKGRKKKIERPRHVNAYFFFYNKFKSFVGESDLETKQKRLDLFSDVFRRGLEVITLELETGDDPQVIFESLNARGEPLLPSDLIKNFVFRIARDQSNPKEQTAEVKKLYEKYWRKFDHEKSDLEEIKNKDQVFWNVEEGVGKHFRSRLDLFFQHFLVLKLKREINSGRIFHEFQEYYRNLENKNIENILKDISEYSVVYKKFMLPNKKTTLGKFFYRLKVMENTTFYPVILYLCKNYSDEQVVSFTSPLESYFVRRMIAQKGTKSYNKISLALLEGLMENKTDIVLFVDNFLQSRKGDNEIWPDNKTFKNSWMETDIYDCLPTPRVRIVLEALEDMINTNRQESIIIEEKLSLEHVMPQAWEKNWDPPVEGIVPNTDEWEDFNEKDYRTYMLHSFGNLTLTTQSLNSANSNLEFKKKKPLITKESKLLMNSYFQDIEKWDEEEIRKRGEQLFNLAIKIWPEK